MGISITHIKMDLAKINTIVLSGGGMKCIGYVGFFKSLFAKIDKSCVKHYIGTSGGGIFALLIILGYNLEEINKIILNYDYSKFIPQINLDNILINCGLSDCNMLKNFIVQILNHKNISENVTFVELYKHTNIKFTVALTNFSKQQLEFVNHELNPEFKIVDAIIATSCIPLFFYPYTINGDIYLDGAIINNYPINFINDDELPNTIGACYIAHKNENDISAIFDHNKNYCQKIIEYIHTIVLLSFNNIIHIINNEQKKRTVNLDTNITTALEFNLSREAKINIILNAFNTTEHFLNNNFIYDIYQNNQNNDNQNNNTLLPLNNCNYTIDI